jgi:hypothetical protein
MNDNIDQYPTNSNLIIDKSHLGISSISFEAKLHISPLSLHRSIT